MKTGDLIRNKKTGDLALVIRSRTPRAHDQSRVYEHAASARVYEYIDFVWVDEALEESAWSGHFEVINESR